MAKKNRPSKAQKAAALELIREGAENVRFISRSLHKSHYDTPIFAAAVADQQTRLF